MSDDDDLRCAACGVGQGEHKAGGRCPGPGVDGEPVGRFTYPDREGDAEETALAGEVWQEADNVLLLCVEPGVEWRDFRAARIPWDAPTIARPLRRLLDRAGNPVIGPVVGAERVDYAARVGAAQAGYRSGHADGFAEGYEKGREHRAMLDARSEEKPVYKPDGYTAEDQRADRAFLVGVRYGRDVTFTTLARVRAAVAEGQELDRRGPDQFKVGQDHLTPAFREVDWQQAFTALAKIMTEVEDAIAEQDKAEAAGQQVKP